MFDHETNRFENEEFTIEPKGEQWRDVWEITFVCSGHPGVTTPGYIFGPPENCYPDEYQGPEYIIEKVLIDGVEQSQEVLRGLETDWGLMDMLTEKIVDKYG